VGCATIGPCSPPCFTGQADSRAGPCHPTGCSSGLNTAHSASRARHDPQIFRPCRAWAGTICVCHVPAHLAGPEIILLCAIEGLHSLPRGLAPSSSCLPRSRYIAAGALPSTTALLHLALLRWSRYGTDSPDIILSRGIVIR
jgi:hypothetical protein